MTEQQINDRLEKYGIENCRDAYLMNRVHGEGCSTISYGLEGNFNWSQVDAMINTWEAFLELEKA